MKKKPREKSQKTKFWGFRSLACSPSDGLERERESFSVRGMDREREWQRISPAISEMTILTFKKLNKIQKISILICVLRALSLRERYALFSRTWNCGKFVGNEDCWLVSTTYGARKRDDLFYNFCCYECEINRIWFYFM